MRRFGIVFGALMLLSSVGCDANAYWKDRGHDFLDMFSVDVAGGAGLGAHGQASVFHTGLGYGQMYHVGLVENKDCGSGSASRNWFAVRPEVQGDLIFRTNSGCMKGEPNAFKDNPFMLSWMESKDRAACAHKCWFIHVPGMDSATATDMKWWDILDCNLAANALVVGARAGARPGQAFDFILGWFTVDFTGDDTMAGAVGQPAMKK